MFAILHYLAQLLFVHVIVTKTTIYCRNSVVPVVTTANTATTFAAQKT